MSELMNDRPTYKDDAKPFDIKKVKCPFCGGRINTMWFDGVSGDYAHFVAECYKRETDENYDFEHHIFRFGIALPETIYIDRKDDNEGLKTNEWVMRK